MSAMFDALSKKLDLTGKRRDNGSILQSNGPIIIECVPWQICRLLGVTQGMFTQIMVKSKDCTEVGFPKRLGVYHIGEVRQIGQYFNVGLSVLSENDLHLPRPPVHLQAGSAKAARELVIGHFTNLATEMKLDIVVTELPDSC